MATSTISTREKAIRVVLAACALLCCMMIGEGMIRLGIRLGVVNYPNPDFTKLIHRFAASYDLVYDLRPNAQGFDGTEIVRTNSLGMKDKEYSIAKPDGVVRMVIVGDSVTFGVSVPERELYSELLEESLNRQGMPIEVLNAAVIGYNSSQEEVALYEKILPLDPDLIVVGYCLNDNSATDGFKEIARQMHPDSIGSRLHSKFISLVLDRLEEATGSWFKSFSGTRHLFKSLAQIQRERQIDTTVVIFPYNFTELEKYKERPRHQQVRELAEAEGIRVLDFLDYTSTLSPEDRTALYLPNDKAHFSPAGMTAIARWLGEPDRLVKRERGL